MLRQRKGVLLDGVGQELVRASVGGRRKTLSQWFGALGDAWVTATGGTAARTLADWMALIIALGATPMSSAMAAVVQAVSLSAGRLALGISAAMDAVVTSATVSAAMELLGVGAFTTTGGTAARSLKDRFNDEIRLEDWGVVVNSSAAATANTTNFNLALAYAYANNKTLRLPAGTVYVEEASGAPGYCLLNQGVSIRGVGTNISAIAPKATVAPTVNIMRIRPEAAHNLDHLELCDFLIYMNVSGSAVGKHGIHILTDLATNLNALHMRNVYIAAGNDYSLRIENAGATNVQGTPTNALIELCQFMEGVNATSHGDNLEFKTCIFRSTSTRVGLRTYAVDTSGVAGHLIVDGCNFDCAGGAFSCLRGRNIRLINNNIEHSAGAGSNGAVVDFDGSSGVITGVNVCMGNHIGIFGTSTATIGIRSHGVADLKVYDNDLEAGITVASGIFITTSSTNVVHYGNKIISFTNAIINSGVRTRAVAALSRGALLGMSIATNGGDATNDIDFAEGICRDVTNNVDIVCVALTKQVDAAWVAGNGVGGLDGGSVDNNTYHCHAIWKESDQTGDFIYSLSHDKFATVTVTIASPAVCTLVGHGLVAGSPLKYTTTSALPTGLTVGTQYYVIASGLTADAFQVSTSIGGAAVNTSGSQSGTHTCYPGPAMPSGYKHYRRIGSIIRSGGANLAFTQNHDEFLLKVPVAGADSASPGTSAITKALTTPIGVKNEAILTMGAVDATPAAATYGLITALDQTDTAPTAALFNFTIAASGAGVPNGGWAYGRFRTDTASRVRVRVDASTADLTIKTVTHGWIDTRGKLT